MTSKEIISETKVNDNREVLGIIFQLNTKRMMKDEELMERFSLVKRISMFKNIFEKIIVGIFHNALPEGNLYMS